MGTPRSGASTAQGSGPDRAGACQPTPCHLHMQDAAFNAMDCDMPARRRPGGTQFQSQHTSAHRPAPVAAGAGTGKRVNCGAHGTTATCATLEIFLRLPWAQVTCALSRQAKEETLERLVPLLQQSALVLGLRYKGLTVCGGWLWARRCCRRPASRCVAPHRIGAAVPSWVRPPLGRLPPRAPPAVQVKQLEKFRSSLPETTKLVVCKNTLVSVATDRVPGWEALRSAAKVGAGQRRRRGGSGAAWEGLGERMGLVRMHPGCRGRVDGGELPDAMQGCTASSLASHPTTLRMHGRATMPGFSCLRTTSDRPSSATWSLTKRSRRACRCCWTSPTLHGPWTCQVRGKQRW